MCVTPQEAAWRVMRRSSVQDRLAQIIEQHGVQNLRFEVMRDASTNSTHILATLKMQITDEYVEMLDWAGGGSGLVG